MCPGDYGVIPRPAMGLCISWEEFRQTAADRRVSLMRGLAQSVRLWLDTNPAPDIERPAITRRVIVCN